MDNWQLFLLVAIASLFFIGLLAIAGLALYMLIGFFFALNSDLIERDRRLMEYRARVKEAEKGWDGESEGDNEYP